jgi:hypothetical protein
MHTFLYSSRIFWRPILVEKRVACVQKRRPPKNLGDKIDFCIRRQRTKTPTKYSKLKTKIFLKTYSSLWPNKGLFNGTTLRPIKSGQTAKPLKPSITISNRDSVTRVSTSGFFMTQLSPAPKIPLLPFQIFLKIFGDIPSSRFTNIDTGGKWKKSTTRKVLIA